MNGVMQVTGAAVFVPALAAIAFAASAGAGTGAGPGAAPDPSGQGGPAVRHRATLMPVSSDPFRVRGTGFRARERVRVTVTPTGRDAMVRRIRATGRGTFVLGFSGIQACAGVEGVAAGSRGSHASFQFSSLTC
jgi:hypothetical protein